MRPLFVITEGAHCRSMRHMLYIYIYIYIYIYMAFTTEGFLEVAIESWSDQDLNQRPLYSVQTL